MIKLFKHTLVYTLGSQVSRVISILILPLVTPYLSNEDYGVNGLALAYIGAFAALKDFGMVSVISNTFYKYPNRYKFIWDRIFSFLSIWNIPLSIFVGFLLFLILPINYGSKLLVICCTCIPMIFFDNYILFCNRYFQFSQRPGPFVLVSFIASIISIFVSFYTIVYLRLGYKGWFIAGFFTQMLTFLIYFFYTKKIEIVNFNFNLNWKWLKKYLKISLPTIPHNYSSFLMETSDRIILGLFMVNINFIGLYNIGYTFGQYFNVINIGLSLATSSFYLKLYNNFSKESEINIRNVTYIIGLMLLILAIISGLWMKEVFGFLIKNSDLMQGYSIAIVIIFSYVGNSFYMSSGNKLIALGKTNILWKVSLTAGLINVLLNILLIPLINIWGSVIATFIANSFLHFRIYFVDAYRKVSYGTSFYPIWWFLLITSCMIMTYLLKEIDVIFKILITIFIFLSVSILYLFNRNRIQEITS